MSNSHANVLFRLSMCDLLARDAGDANGAVSLRCASNDESVLYQYVSADQAVCVESEAS